MPSVIMAMTPRDVRITSPCTLDWTKMTPAQGGRFCGDCKKVVRDLSKMTERQARELLAKERNQDLCVRMLVDRDGNVFFGGDALVSASLLSKAKRAAAAAAAIAIPFATQACTAITQPLGLTASEQTDEPPDHEPLMGGVAADDQKRIPDDEDASADAATEAAADGGEADASPDASPDATPDADVDVDGGVPSID